MSQKPTAIENSLNYGFLKERLDDVSLLDAAVAVPCHDTVDDPEQWDIAAPCGGRRRAGFCYASSNPVIAARAVAQMLARPADFPDLRWDPEHDTLSWGVDVVRATREAGVWGEADLYDRMAGELYGYSDAAIDHFIATRPERMARAAQRRQEREAAIAELEEVLAGMKSITGPLEEQLGALLDEGVDGCPGDAM